MIKARHVCSAQIIAIAAFVAMGGVVSRACLISGARIPTGVGVIRTVGLVFRVGLMSIASMGRHIRSSLSARSTAYEADLDSYNLVGACAVAALGCSARDSDTPKIEGC
jgi:hypothetical protein